MKNHLWKIISILVVATILGFYNLPDSTQDRIAPFLADGKENKVLLGLDLQGGSQLDYKIVLPEGLEQSRKDELVDGVRTVIEKRVNSLGVAQPNIYNTQVGDETHIVVELAEAGNVTQEDVDKYLGENFQRETLTEDQVKQITLAKAKETVGKTIQLEFKTQKTDIDPNEEQAVLDRAKAELAALTTNQSDFNLRGQSLSQAEPSRISFQTPPAQFADALPSSFKDILAGMQPGQIYKEPIRNTNAAFQNGGLNDQVSILKLISKSEEVRHPKQVEISHILIAHTEVEGAHSDITRSKDEAFDLAKDLRQKALDGADFATIAKDYSDDKATKDNGGKLEKPVSSDGSYVFNIEDAALKLNENQISEVVEAPDGYHIIRANAVKTDVAEPKYTYASINYSLAPDMWEATTLNGEHFVSAIVQPDPITFEPTIAIQFDAEGTKMFREITEQNVGKPVAIFVGGELISAPTVNEVIPSGQAVISGGYNNESAAQLARDLNTGAIPAPIVLAGEYTIGATIGQEALNKSLNAGLIGVAIVMLFMFAFYRRPGLIANLALLVYGIVLIFLIKASFSLPIALAVSLSAFAIMVYKVLNNEDKGWDKFISFILSCFGLFFIASLLSNKIVLDLAGIAGIILSVGMAVDANILIFERMKEEIRSGKTLDKAIDQGFSRAWTAIRDSNFSTFFTCGILFIFGSSIVKGFAMNLAAGVLVSMFTAITITKVLMRGFFANKLNQKYNPFGELKEPAKVKYINKTKTFFGFSGALVVISILFMFFLKPNLGIDFTGGSLIQMNFAEPVTKEQLTDSFQKAQSTLQPSAEMPAATESSESAPTITNNSEKVDFSDIQLIETGENDYIVKTPYITSEQFDLVEENLKTTLPAFEVERFSTIGPSLSKNILAKSAWAVFYAMLVIILYVAFAFRSVPKHVSKWRFGASAIVALVHDVIIVTGIFLLLGQFIEVNIDAMFITAMLTVFGYSVNDTIVVLDRLREKLVANKEESLAPLADQALNETMRRSIYTSLTTILTLVAILLFGSESIFFFVLALTLGIGVGTYSSVFVATALLVHWEKKGKK